MQNIIMTLLCTSMIQIAIVTSSSKYERKIVQFNIYVSFKKFSKVLSFDKLKHFFRQSLFVSMRQHYENTSIYRFFL